MKLLFAKYNRERLPLFRTETRIFRENGNLAVSKRALGPEAEAHIRRIYDNGELLRRSYLAIAIAEAHLRDRELIFEFIPGRTLDSLLIEPVHQYNTDAFWKGLEKYCKLIRELGTVRRSGIESDEDFCRIFGSLSGLGETECLLISNLDLTFDNILWDEKRNRYVLIDYEWVFEFPVPVNFVLRRAIQRLWYKHEKLLGKFTTLFGLLNVCGIESDVSDIYDRMERGFQIFVHGRYGKNEFYFDPELYMKPSESLSAVFSERDEKRERVRALDIKTKELEIELNTTMNQANTLQSELKAITDHANALQHEMTRIRMSNGWKALMYLYRVRDIVIPIGSRRRSAFKQLIGITRKSVRFYQMYGLKNFVVKIFRKTITQQKPAATVIHLDRAEFFSNIVEVSGWAISRKKIGRLEITLNDQPIGQAIYGNPRQDVQELYPQFMDSRNSGFFFYAMLKNQQARSETQRIGVQVFDEDGHVLAVRDSENRGDTYGQFIEDHSISEGQISWMQETSKSLPDKPQFLIFIPAESEKSEALLRTIASISDQAYPFWRIVLTGAERLSSNLLEKIKPVREAGRLKAIPGDIPTGFLTLKNFFVGFMKSGDALSPDALFETAKAINESPEGELFYFDEDLLSEGERTRPFFKPDWSPDLLLGMNYIGSAFFVKGDQVENSEALQKGTCRERIYDLLLNATEANKGIVHIPRILFSAGRQGSSPEEGLRKVLEKNLLRRGIAGEVVSIDREAMLFRVKREITGTPKISIIMATAYKSSTLLEECLESIVELSSYRNFEIILVDNSHGKLPKPDYEEKFASVPLLILTYDDEFNFSRVNNVAAESATGDYLVFLNDDTRVVSSDWLESMLEQAQRPEVGVVGVKLLYEDNTIQHGGVFLTDMGGGALHSFRYLPAEARGANNLLAITRNCSAVTFACVMVRGEVFRELGGLDEHLRIECNDTDFCLRARKAGYLVVWTPFAVLYHRELTTRIKTGFKDDESFFWDRWRSVLEKGDPYYNPNLTLDAETFSINSRPVRIEHHEPYLPPEAISAPLNPEVIDPERMKNILLLKLDHIGDVILSLPTVKMLRDRIPDAKVTMLVGTWAKPILEKIPYLDRVLCFDFFHEKSEQGKRDLSEAEIKSLQDALKPFAFDVAVDLRKQPETRDILKYTGARYLAGYSIGKKTSWLTYTHPLRGNVQDIPYQRSKQHVSAQIFELVHRILPPQKNGGSPQISTPQMCLSGVDSPESLPTADFLVGIHPGAGGAIKQWPVAYFARLADMLIERRGAKIVFFGGNADEDLAHEIIRGMQYRDKALSLAGRLSLSEFMSSIGRLHLFIGNNSGPSHIAGVLGAPTLNIFGGQILPDEWHPLGLRTMSIKIDLKCSPCYKPQLKDCPHDLKCLKNLWPEQVYSAAEELLAIAGIRRK